MGFENSWGLKNKEMGNNATACGKMGQKELRMRALYFFDLALKDFSTKTGCSVNTEWTAKKSFEDYLFKSCMSVGNYILTISGRKR